MDKIRYKIVFDRVEDTTTLPGIITQMFLQPVKDGSGRGKTNTNLTPRGIFKYYYSRFRNDRPKSV